METDEFYKASGYCYASIQTRILLLIVLSMKNLSKLSILFLTISILFACSKEDKIPADVAVNDFIWKGLNAYYLHQDKISNLSDRKFSSQPELNNYLRGFTDSEELFTSLLFDRPNTDNKSVLISDYNTVKTPAVRTAITNGIEFGIIEEPGNPANVLGYVTHILPNSNATLKDITRGTFFNAVDGVQLTKENYTQRLSATTTELSIATFDGSIVTSTAKKVQLTKTAYTHVPVFMSKTFVEGTNTIGYLLYNNDFSTNYIADLNNTFLEFKNQGATQLVFDLRYNIGGGSFAKTIAQMASMITGQFANQPLIKEKWNVKAQPWFETNQPDSLITNFSDQLNPTTAINGLQLTDVYLILNGTNFKGSSAIELLINSLRSYINVHVVGRKTAGNNTGAITLYNSADYDFEGRNTDHTYALQPIVLEFLNKNDESYATGIIPSIETCAEEDILNLGVLGETSDPLLENVLNYIATGIIGANPVCNPNNFEFLYSSIQAQRIFDAGVFIEQNLPNTY
ncbi:MAG: S41 family peptidase [Polaribacter sp.]|nr:S41 family peptidase [Polaribacter sp.]